MKKPADTKIQYLATFLGFTTIENIDKFYNKKYQNWLYRNSHFIENFEPDPDELFFLKYDSDGNIINATFSRATEDEILLNEKDFINLEISVLNNLDASLLAIDDRMRIEFYKNYLISKLTSDKPSEIINLYSHIFKANAFDVWQSMFEAFDVTESSRTDVKFMFDEMKKQGLIHKTIDQVDILEWISETYNLTIEKTSHHSRKPARLSIYSNAKELFKK